MKKTLIILMFAAIASAATQTTHADYTSPDSLSEIEIILNREYANGTPFLMGSTIHGNGTIEATQVLDSPFRPVSLYGPVDLLAGNETYVFDQLWMTGSANASARIVDTDNGNYQAFGYSAGDSYVEWITTDDTEPVETTLNGQFEWVYTNGSDLSSNNGYGPDNMITYEITGLNNGYEKTWLLFWDDFQGPKSGLYSDLVVEITASPVPVPGAFMLGGIGIACLGWIKRRQHF